MNIDHMVAAPVQPVKSPMTATARYDADLESMPTSYQMAAPLNEAELTMLLMASPMYQKLEKMKRNIASGGVRSAGHKAETG